MWNAIGKRHGSALLERSNGRMDCMGYWCRNRGANRVEVLDEETVVPPISSRCVLVYSAVGKSLFFRQVEELRIYEQEV